MSSNTHINHQKLSTGIQITISHLILLLKHYDLKMLMLFDLRYSTIVVSKQLKQLYDETYSDFQDAFNPYFKVYRGLILFDEDIDRLKIYVNQHVSTNGFLSIVYQKI